MSSAVSRLDVLYRKILLTKFFVKGWGAPDDILQLFKFRKIVSNRDKCYNLVPKDYPIRILNEQKFADHKVIEGKFQSPFDLYLPDLLVPEIKESYFQLVVPNQWPKGDYKPLLIQLAGTGDHYFWRRRNLMAKPLLQAGIGSIILENPYYGLRKPKDQLRSSLHYVSDIFVMGGCLILECIALLHWCERMGYGPLGISGISMGGHMASLAASSWPKPIVLVPCLSWSTASSVFTEGVMSESIDWDMLQKQFFSNKIYCDSLSKDCKIVDSPFACTLSRIPEYGLTGFADDKADMSYVSPYEMMTMPDQSSCPDVAYKSSSPEIDATPTEHKKQSLKSLSKLKEATFFKTSQNVIAMRKRDKEAIWFMRGMMDEFTHLKNFSVPYEPRLVTAICAKSDGYVPRTGISKLEDIWPGVTVKYLDTGHVGAYIWYRKLFRDCICETFDKAKKFVPPPGPFLEA